jgi:hypothetical protein
LDLICTAFLIKMNMKNLKLYLVTLISTLFVSCESNTYQEISKIPEKDVVITNPTYENNIKSIISNNCVGCHSLGTVNQSPYLRNYNEVKDAVANGDVLCRIQGLCGDVMPQSGKMPQANIDLIKLWSTKGYIN